MVAIVTGGSRGIGAAIVGELFRQGYSVAVVSRGGGVPVGLTDFRKVRGYKADVSVEADVAHLYGQIVREFATPAVLVNNAGIIESGDMSFDRWKRVMDGNLTSAMLMTYAFIPQLIKSDAGRIINIGSVSSLVGYTDCPDYATSKAGLLGLTRSIAKKYGPDGVTCNTVCPGPIETDMTKDMDPERKERIISRMAVKRFGTPREVASLVAYLCSYEAGFITGQEFVIDGGLLA